MILQKKIISIFSLLFCILLLCIFLYIRHSDPEVICQNVPPGDPTCMSVEALHNWCLKGNEKTPQCINTYQAIKFYIVEKILNDRRLRPYLGLNDKKSTLYLASHLIEDLDLNRLTSFGFPVVSTKKTHGRSIRFILFDCNVASYCHIKFQYNLEKIVGEVLAKIEGDGYILKKFSITKQ